MIKKSKFSSIIDSNYCPNLNQGDEIVNINNNSTLKTLEDYHLLFHSLWYNQCEYVQMTVNKLNNLPIIPSKLKQVLFREYFIHTLMFYF